MQNMEELNIPDSILDELRCSICTGYLSSAPVQVLPDGSSICSLCSPSTEQPAYRQLTFEALLSKFSFPCKFAKNGCEERLRFGHLTEHEDECNFQSFICPCVPNKACAWEGSLVQISKHFTAEHQDLVKEKLDFKVQIDQDFEGILIVMLDGIPLIMKYKYNGGTSNLQHDVRLLTCNKYEATYKIKLMNDLDHDFTSMLKGGSCLPYNKYFYNMQDSKVLIVNNFLQGLDNPSHIIVAVKVAVTKSDNNQIAEKELKVDYDLFQSFRCVKCHGYLIPPLFNGSKGDGVICCYCHDEFGGCGSLENSELSDRVAKANFTCRWRGCELVVKAGNIREHQLICTFRTFVCKECETTFTWEDAVSHLQSHDYEHFTDTFVYTTTFNKPFPMMKLFTFSNNEIVYITYQTYYDQYGYSCYCHKLSMSVTGSYSSNITSKIEFEHAHCKIKSEAFTITTKGRKILTSNLPACFESNQELTVTLKI